tara:strand:+ start:387 stop:602 length:216 start_codon:yes stop_codon:yes gene_type:complete
MKLSDVKTFRDLCSSIFVLEFEPEIPEKECPKCKGTGRVRIERKRKRARTKGGRYKADNPATKDVNEAWEQ